MAFCKNCGAELQADQKFCGNCGAPIEEKEEKTENTAEQGTYGEAPKSEPISEEVFQMPAQTGKLSVGMLVWAIINTVFSICTCCLPIGVLPLVFAILTNKADYETSQKNRKIALICNIIVTALIVIFAVVEIISMIVTFGTLEQMLINYADYYGYEFYF